MYTKIQVVFDAAEPGKLAEFWALALDYVFEPPPEGHETWEDFGRSIGMPEEEFGDQASVIDPADEGPRLYFQRVPEGKVAKNRVHLDVRVAGHEIRGEERKRLVSEKVEQLVQAGASLAWESDDVRGSAIVLRDPEGNEFCVCWPAGRRFSGSGSSTGVPGVLGTLRRRDSAGQKCQRRRPVCGRSVEAAGRWGYRVAELTHDGSLR